MNRMTRVRCLLSYLECVSHQAFKNIAHAGCLRHFVYVFICVIVIVFVFVSSYDFFNALSEYVGSVCIYGSVKLRSRDIYHLQSDDGHT